MPSALLLLEDVNFYRGRSRALRALLGGAVEALVVEQEETRREVEPAGATIESEHVSTA